MCFSMMLYIHMFFFLEICSLQPSRSALAIQSGIILLGCDFGDFFAHHQFFVTIIITSPSISCA